MIAGSTAVLGLGLLAYALTPPVRAAPAGAVAGTRYVVRHAGFRISFDVEINGRRVGRLIERGLELSITPYLVHGSNRLHVTWNALGRPSFGSLAVRAIAGTSTRTVTSVRKDFLGPDRGGADVDFQVP